MIGVNTSCTQGQLTASEPTAITIVRPPLLFFFPSFLPICLVHTMALNVVSLSRINLFTFVQPDCTSSRARFVLRIPCTTSAPPGKLAFPTLPKLDEEGPRSGCWPKTLDRSSSQAPNETDGFPATRLSRCLSPTFVIHKASCRGKGG